MEACAGTGPAGNGRALVSRKALAVLAPSLGPTAGKTAHRFGLASADPAHGRGQPSLGRSADSRGAAENSESPSRNARCRAILPGLGQHRHRPGGHFSQTTSASWASPLHASSPTRRTRTTVSTPGVVAPSLRHQANDRASAISRRLSSGLCHDNARPLTGARVPFITEDANTSAPAHLPRSRGGCLRRGHRLRGAPEDLRR